MRPRALRGALGESDCPRAGLSGCLYTVLSIGKLAAGQARYYLDQAEVRVDALQSISGGVEEYYAGGAEARGMWVGTAAAGLGVSGAVDGGALRRVLAGLDPRDSLPLRASSSPVVELTENHRQVNAWERAALEHLRDGRAESAVALYQQHERVVVDDTPERSRGRLVADWWAVGDLSRSVMLAQRRDDVADLNARARAHMRAAGRLGEQELRLPGGRFAVGDHLIAKRNDLRRGVVNGERGRVVAVDPDARRLTLDCHDDRIVLDARYLDDRTVRGDPTLQHGYAMTVHVAQGLTVDHAFVLAGPGLNRELGYTALSRGRHTNRLYAARDPETARLEYAPTDPYRDDPIARLTAQLATSSATTLAIDIGSDREPDDGLAETTHRHAQAAAQRRAAENTRGRWLPRRRRELLHLRHAEDLAAHRLEDLRRQQAERSHGQRPFVTGHETRRPPRSDESAACGAAAAARTRP